MWSSVNDRQIVYLRVSLWVSALSMVIRITFNVNSIPVLVDKYAAAVWRIAMKRDFPLELVIVSTTTGGCLLPINLEKYADDGIFEGGKPQKQDKP